MHSESLIHTHTRKSFIAWVFAAVLIALVVSVPALCGNAAFAGNDTAAPSEVPDSSKVAFDDSASVGGNTAVGGGTTVGGSTAVGGSAYAESASVASVRLAGSEAYETSAAIAQESFSESDWAILARSDDFADAMSATGLAGVLDAPVVLTEPDRLSDAALSTLQNLGVENVYIIGGNVAMPYDFESALRAAGVTGTIERVAGSEYYDTSVACAQKIVAHGGSTTRAIIAYGQNFQDALSISSFAYKYGVPIFLQTSGDTSSDRALTADAAEMLATGAYSKAALYVPGGPGAVSTASVEDIFGSDLRGGARIYGENGYDTSNELANYFVEQKLLSAETTCIATGAAAAKGVDALAGAALAGKRGGVMLLVSAQKKMEALNYTTINKFLVSQAKGVASCYLLGGTYVLPSSFQTQVDRILAGEASHITGQASPSTTGKLHVEGTQLVSEAGEAVQLRGVSTHGLAWYPGYVNQALFSELSSDWNANVVRLALYTAEYGGYCTGGDKSQLLALIYQGVEYARQADLYVIVDWHILHDTNPLEHKDEAVEFFNTVSSALSGYNNVLYEICNEPNGSTSWEDVKSYAEQVIPVIRANDPSALVIVGTPTWSQDVDKAAANPLAFDNIMYTLHFYAATHKDDLRAKLENVVNGGLPVFVTEFGISDASGNGSLDYASGNEWVALMDRLGVSYVCWSLSNKDETSALIKASCQKTSGFALDDLSDEGAWYWGVLAKDASGNSQTGDGDNSNSGETPDDGNNGNSGETPGDDTGGNTGQTGSPTSTQDTNGSLSWQISEQNSWESNGAHFVQYSLSITNTSSTSTSGWEVRIPFSSEPTLSQNWNGNVSVEGSTLCVSNVDYNASIAAGATLRDIGFIVSF